MGKNNTPRKTKWGLLLLFFIIGIIPVKAQLYIGGGFNYHKTQESYPDRQIKHLIISPELGYRYKKFSAGLTFSYSRNNSQVYNDYYPSGFEPSDIETIIALEPYIRYDLVVRKGFGFFVDAFYTFTHNNPKVIPNAHMAGLSPGVYYKLSDRFIALFRFGLIGYSSHDSNGFKGFGVDLSMNTSRIGFYYSFW